MGLFTESFSTKSLHYGASPAPAIVIPDKDKLVKQVPISIGVDVSRSTGLGAVPDSFLIQETINGVIAELRDPTPGTGLADNIHKTVISAFAFNDTATDLFKWSKSNALPQSVTLPPPSGSTALGAAIEHILASYGDLLRTFRDPANNVRSGPLTMLIITDGCLTDYAVGSPKWTALHSKLTSFNAGEKPKASVAFYVTPNGCALGDNVFRMRDASGNEITGQATMALLGGPKSVYEMKEAAAFPALVQTITAVITSISRDFGTLHDAADQAARQTNGLITSYA